MRSVLLLAVAGLAALTSAHSRKRSRGGDKLVDVKLSSESGSLVKVSVKNISRKKLDFLQRGTILDDNPIHKFEITSKSGQSASFIGVHPRVNMGVGSELNQESFRQLKPGHTVNFEIDAAHLYDMTAGGEFDIVAEGNLPYSTTGKRKISGDSGYKSNTIKITVDPTYAVEAKARWVIMDDMHGGNATLEKRGTLGPDCAANAGKSAATQNALALCASLAFAAGNQAIRGNVDQFVRYFRTADPNMRNLVSQRFLAVAAECGSRSNKAKTYCTDPRQFCRSDYIAYTLGTEITNCDMYWTFPLVNLQCHGVSQATTTIHEMTHVDGLFEPSTDDFPGHYGWPALSNLPPEQAVMNGDNYGFYANAVYTNNVNC